MQFLLLTLVISLSLLIVKAVDRSKFRTCQDSSFCRRYRHRAPISHEAYSIDKSSLHRVKSNQLIGEVRSSLASSPLRLSIEVQRIGSVRLKITENIPRWQVSKLSRVFRCFLTVTYSRPIFFKPAVLLMVNSPKLLILKNCLLIFSRFLWIHFLLLNLSLLLVIRVSLLYITLLLR